MGVNESAKFGAELESFEELTPRSPKLKAHEEIERRQSTNQMTV